MGAECDAESHDGSFASSREIKDKKCGFGEGCLDVKLRWARSLEAMRCDGALARSGNSRCRGLALRRRRYE